MGGLGDNRWAMADKEQGPGRDGGGDAGNSGLKGLVQAESMVQLAFAVPGGCVVGLLIGGLLDRHFHQHWMTVTLMLLGAVGGFIQIITVALRSGKRGV